MQPLRLGGQRRGDSPVGVHRACAPGLAGAGLHPELPFLDEGARLPWVLLCISKQPVAARGRRDRLWFAGVAAVLRAEPGSASRRPARPGGAGPSAVRLHLRGRARGRWTGPGSPLLRSEGSAPAEARQVPRASAHDLQKQKKCKAAPFLLGVGAALPTWQGRKRAPSDPPVPPGLSKGGD